MRTKNQRETICRYCTRLPRSCAGSVLRQLRSERPKLLGWLGDPETPPKRPSGRLLQWGAISSFDCYKRATSVGRSERTVARASLPSRWLGRGRRQLHRHVFWLTNEESMRNRQDESLLSVE